MDSFGGQNSYSDPSNGGWDTTIVKAPDRHKGGKRRRRGRGWKKFLIDAAVVIAVVAVVGLAGSFLYVKTLDVAMALGDDADQIMAELADAPAGEPFYVLLLGSDLRENYDAETVASGINGTGYSDVIMLMRVDTANSKVTLLSIPRDTPYTGADGKIQKLNAVYHSQGAVGLIREVQKLTGVKIAHYAEIGGNEFVALVDGLGGISVDVPVGMDYTTLTGDRVSIKAGLQHLNGAEALAVANNRMVYSSDQDANRQKGARLVVQALIDAIRTRPVAQIPGILTEAAACVKTDMTVGEIVDVVRMLGPSPTVLSGTGPYDGALDPYTSATGSVNDAMWLCYVNEAGWQRAMETVYVGEDPAALSYAKDIVHFAGQPKETWSRGPVAPADLVERKPEPQPEPAPEPEPEPEPEPAEDEAAPEE